MMRRSHSDIKWEADVQKATDQEQDVVNLSDVSDDAGYGEVREVTLSTGDDDVFIEETKGERQKKKNSIEIELQIEIDEIERLLIVEKEKSRSYRKESDNKEASLAKERALVKHWKKEAEKEKEKNDELVNSLKKELKVSSHVKKQNKRIVDEYYYLRDLYDSRSSSRSSVQYESRSSSRASVQHAKVTDMEEYSDQE